MTPIERLNHCVAVYAEIGETIRAARLDAGLSQVALAERIGVEQPLISDYERGVRRPSIDTVAAIVRAIRSRS